MWRFSKSGSLENCPTKPLVLHPLEISSSQTNLEAPSQRAPHHPSGSGLHHGCPRGPGSPSAHTAPPEFASAHNEEARLTIQGKQRVFLNTVQTSGQGTNKTQTTTRHPIFTASIFFPVNELIVRETEFPFSWGFFFFFFFFIFCVFGQSRNTVWLWIEDTEEMSNSQKRCVPKPWELVVLGAQNIFPSNKHIINGFQTSPTDAASTHNVVEAPYFRSKN